MTLGPTNFEISSPDVVAEDFGTEIVVLNLFNGKYFSLVDVAADVWRDIANGYRPLDLSHHLRETDSPSAVAVEQFLEALISESLIRPSSKEAMARDAACATAVSALDHGAPPPRLDVFDDMVDLITCDPIHEVDEDLGWPVKREAI